MALHTQSLYVIGIHATAGTAKPTIPAAGTHMTMTGYKTIGSQEEGHDLDMDDESVTFPEIRENVKIMAPRANGIAAMNRRKVAHDAFEFTAYDVSDTLIALDSDKTITSGKSSISSTRALRAVCAELHGYKSRYFPSCLVEVIEISAGQDEDGGARCKVRVTPLGTSAIPAGYEDDTFDGA